MLRAMHEVDKDLSPINSLIEHQEIYETKGSIYEEKLKSTPYPAFISGDNSPFAPSPDLV